MIAGLDRLHIGNAIETRSARDLPTGSANEIEGFAAKTVQIGATSGSGPHHQSDPPYRHAKYFENELMTRACRRHSAAVNCGECIVGP